MRGESSERVHIESLEQKMPQGKSWQEFFHNDSNKDNLIRMATEFFQSAEGRKIPKTPLTITCKDEAWIISRSNVEILPRCNHEEANTRIILPANSEDTPVVVAAKDTDVFVLLFHAMQRCEPEKEWFMRADSEKFVKI